MSNTLKFGNGKWATKEGSTLAYNDENGNFKPLPFDFTRDSGATRVNEQGLIENVPIGVPRIDFSDDANGALLLEPERRNLILSSENISGAGWGASGWTLTNDFISPDGTNNAYSILRTTGVGVSTTLSLLANTTYTYSVYIKNVDATNIQLRVQNAAGNSSGTESNCVVFQVTDQTNTNNFTRITHTFNTGDAGSYGIFLGYYSAGKYIAWGAQVEQGSYATSYIPTQGSIGTRVAESCNGAGNASTFNDSEGVLFWDGYIPNDGNEKILQISDGTNTNVVRIFARANGDDVRFQITVGGVNSLSQEIPISSNNYYKISLKYKENDISIWVNGFELYNVNNGSMPSNLNTLEFNSDGGANAFYGKTKQIQYFNTALTDAELAALTS